ncbi:hypothetical protein MPSEU_000930900 [Mayamaea pseudoterrestris]|nr:hypothetical protein MPSEU_000930900 [Mayamaea pseudoterrestris]
MADQEDDLTRKLSSSGEAIKEDDDVPDDDSATDTLTKQTFQSLSLVEPLCRACDALGWKTATQIQAQVLPEAFAGNDMIGLAETGSGKTGAFVLPILQGLLTSATASKHQTRALILCPTRELAFQILEVVQALGQTIAATSTCIVGGVDRASQAIALARNPHIVIATPGRLIDHLQDTKGFTLRHVQYLVLDEADRMLSMDFEQELHRILDNLPACHGEGSNGVGRQTFLFSATMTSQVAKLQRASLRSTAVRIQISEHKFVTPKQLKQFYMFLPAKYKDCYLVYLLSQPDHLAGKSILVFGATCNNVQRLALMLRQLGLPAMALHGQMSQPQRLGALQKFRAGQRQILVCTDVASRGLDLPAVDSVIHYDLPGHGKEYIHRTGRTARAGKSGLAIAMVTQYDVEIYQRLEGLLGTKLPEYNMAATEETVLILLERVSDAQRLATRELKEQLSSRDRKGGGGRRKRRSGDDGEEEDNGGMEKMLQKELDRRYKGGSGGSGGALKNQRGSGKQSKKYRQK